MSSCGATNGALNDRSEHGHLRVGVFGVGNMGEPMTINLLSSDAVSSVTVYGRTPARLSGVEDAGARVAGTPRELAERSDVILSVLPDLPQLRDLLDGPDGILAGVGHPVVIVISSTSSPSGVRALAGELHETTHGLVHVVDAPVSGGTDGAAARTLSIMAGGSEDDFGRVRDVLAAMGTPVLLGPLGSGEVAKACNQLVVAATKAALSEAPVIAERSGLDVAALLGLFSGGYAGSRLLDSRKQRLIDKDYRVSGPAGFMVKDLRFATDAATATNTATPQLNMLSQLFTSLVDAGLGDDDLSVLQKHIASLPRS
jgi:2-hydroxy-3-oxopropionate reductase